MPQLLSGALLVAAIVMAIIAILKSSRRTMPPQGAPELTPTPKTAAAAKVESPSDTDESVRNHRGAAAVENGKLVIHALLQSLSEQVETLLQESLSYGDALDRHKSTLRKAVTVAEIQKLERVMMNELEAMQLSNSKYRAQLDEANAKVKTQQDELVRLQADVDIDFLTKIHNRRCLDARITEEIDRAGRYGGTFSLVMMDIDHFKTINDFNGHLAGDRILRAVAELLNEGRRVSDFLARYGGDEFVLLLPQTNASQAMTLAEHVRERVAHAKISCEGKVIRVRLSAGVGEVVPGKDTAESLVKRVDAALYAAKKTGRNRVSMASLLSEGNESKTS